MIILRQPAAAVGDINACSGRRSLPGQPGDGFFAWHAGLGGSDNFVGIVQTGHWTTKVLSDILMRLLPGFTELMVHPAYAAGLESQPTRLIGSRQRELEMLCGPKVKQLCSQYNIKLIHYGQLAELRHPA